MLIAWTYRPVIFDYERGNTSNGDFQQSEVSVSMCIFLVLLALLSHFCPGWPAGGLGVAPHLTVQTEAELLRVRGGKQRALTSGVR